MPPPPPALTEVSVRLQSTRGRPGFTGWSQRPHARAGVAGPSSDSLCSLDRLEFFAGESERQSVHGEEEVAETCGEQTSPTAVADPG